MFGVSMWEFGVIMVVVLLVYGPEKLPEAARTFGRLMGQFRRSSDQLKREFYQSVYHPMDDVNRDLRAVGRELRASTRTLVPPIEPAAQPAPGEIAENPAPRETPSAGDAPEAPPAPPTDAEPRP